MFCEQVGVPKHHCFRVLQYILSKKPLPKESSPQPWNTAGKQKQQTEIRLLLSDVDCTHKVRVNLFRMVLPTVVVRHMLDSTSEPSHLLHYPFPWHLLSLFLGLSLLTICLIIQESKVSWRRCVGVFSPLVMSCSQTPVQASSMG